MMLDSNMMWQCLEIEHDRTDVLVKTNGREAHSLLSFSKY